MLVLHSKQKHLLQVKSWTGFRKKRLVRSLNIVLAVETVRPAMRSEAFLTQAPRAKLASQHFSLLYIYIYCIFPQYEGRKEEGFRAATKKDTYMTLTTRLYCTLRGAVAVHQYSSGKSNIGPHVASYPETRQPRNLTYRK